MGWRAKENPAFFSAWVLTVGSIQRAQREKRGAHQVTYLCDTCGLHGDVDIEKLVRLKGRDYSLVNRRCRCRLTLGCLGWVRFRYQHGHLIPLWDEATAQRWIDQADAARRTVASYIHRADDERERMRRMQRR